MPHSGEPPGQGRIVALLCLAEVLSMTGFATWPSLLPQLQETWRLSGKEAGLVGGVFFCGYMLAVPWLSSLTDRIDARRVYFFSCLLTAAGCLGFALIAEGALTAGIFQMLTGAGLAGTYMPGLKALTDRIVGPRQARYIAFYTSTFGIGASFSYALSGGIADAFGWRNAFVLAALGPLLASALVLYLLRPLAPPAGVAHRAGFLHMLGVLKDRVVLGYVAGYAVHCWELLGLRAWIVALLAFGFAAGSVGAAAVPLAPASAAALVNLIGIPASILGNELAGRIGRRRLILGAMLLSGVLAWLAGLAILWPWHTLLAVLLLYNVAVMADSAALTAGLIAAADPLRRGAAMAVYSMFGFGAGFLGPLLFGTVLDAGGGHLSANAWLFACGSLGLGSLLAPLVARFTRHAGDHRG
ncbi:MAG: MFS transporter [Proteobacteria bacterium]|nr:MFS transporter [Pseudomonadota bacterium]